MDEVKKCVNCGAEIAAGDDYEVDAYGEVYCEDCRDELYWCDHCGQYFPNTEYFTEINGEYWCESCVDRDAVKCEECGELIPDNEDYGDRWIHLCEKCRNNSYVECYECRDLIYIDNAYYSESRNEWYCSDCVPNETIKDYGYDMNTIFYEAEEESNSDLHMGFELEAGGVREYEADEIAEHLLRDYDDAEEYFVLKHDGSIPDSGFELVSQPMTLKYHRGFKWESILNDMSTGGLRSHDLGEDGCGLHVHVDRRYLSANQWILIDWFISKYQSKWEAIARRNETSWAMYKKADDKRPVTDKYGKSGSRYSAVNFNNYKTVEFRLCRGTLKYETFIATLEIIDALVRWIKTIRPSQFLKEDAFEMFTAYVTSNDYPAAVAYLQKKQLI